MAAIALPRLKTRALRQPVGVCGVDWKNPITRGLLVAFDGRTAREMVRPARFSAAGATLPTKVGRGYEIAGSSSVAQLAGRTLPSTAATAFVLLDHTTPPSRYAALFGRGTYSGGSGDAADFSLNSGVLVCYSASTGGSSGTLGTAPTSGVHNYTIASTGSAVTAYIDGIQSGSDASYVWGLATGAVPWLIGASATDLLTEYMPGKYLLALIWNRTLSAAEIRSLHVNPWQIFKSAPRLWLVPTGSPPQLLSPTGRLAGSTWTASTGGTTYSCVDETSPDDGDYAYTTTPDDWEEFTFDAPDSQHNGSAAGGYVRYRLPAGSGAITVELRQGATVLETWGPHTLTGTLQAFAQPITASTSNSSDLRLRFTAS